ncbi:hypothetical protein D3C87_1770320 [compost metagenome]
MGDIVGNTPGVIGDFAIELLAVCAVAKMASADSAGLSDQFSGSAADVPEFMAGWLHSCSPQELYPEVLAM